VKTRYIRLVVHSEQGGKPFAACAEFTPIFAGEAGVKDLGVAPGFND